MFTLEDSHPLHKKFCKEQLHIFSHQLRRVWNRMVFSGTGLAPYVVKDEKEMLEKISSTPNSIGYIEIVPDNENIKRFISDK